MEHQARSMSTLARLLLEDEPASIVLLGGAELDEVATALGEHGCQARCFVTLADCLRAESGEGADRALLSLSPEVTSRPVREHLIGAACRAFPSQLLLQVPACLGLPPSELFAFGFRQRHTSAASSIYEYRLNDYKQPPDWLNARFWANPDRFALDPDEADSLFDETDTEDEE